LPLSLRAKQKESHSSQDGGIFLFFGEGRISQKNHFLFTSKTTTRFKENDKSLFEKRQVTFRKTTGHFSETTGRFIG